MFSHNIQYSTLLHRKATEEVSQLAGMPLNTPFFFFSLFPFFLFCPVGRADKVRVYFDRERQDDMTKWIWIE